MITTYTTEEIVIRTLLLAGMILHKLVWEIAKRRQVGIITKDMASPSPVIRLVKLVKILALFFLILQTIFLDVFPISEKPTILRWVGVGIFACGLALAIAGRLALGKNWENIEDYQVLPGQRLVDSGVYRLIRHPIYTGDWLLILGLELALNSWLVLIAIPLAIYLFYQARTEEVLLVDKIPGYADYQKRTKMFVPNII
jgi:protein-S-isoprenylcysteine O-methyltransferase Ste14